MHRSGREADEVAALLLSKGVNAPKKLARVSVAELGLGSEVPGGVLATVRETLEKAVELKRAAAARTAPEHVNAGPLGAMPSLREPREEGQWVPGVRVCARPTVNISVRSSAWQAKIGSASCCRRLRTASAKCPKRPCRRGLR